MNRAVAKGKIATIDLGRLLPPGQRPRHFVHAATIGLNVYLYVVIPKGFFPQQDTGQIWGGVRGDAFSSFQLMKGKLQQVARIIQQDPAVQSVVGTVGGGTSHLTFAVGDDGVTGGDRTGRRRRVMRRLRGRRGGDEPGEHGAGRHESGDGPASARRGVAPGRGHGHGCDCSDGCD